MREAEHKPFLDRLRADPRKFTNKNLLHDIILSDHPRLFFKVLEIGRELIAANRMPPDTLSELFMAEIPMSGIFNRLMSSRTRSETLIETVLKVMAKKPAGTPDRELKDLQRILISCFSRSAPHIGNLRYFLLYSSPELVTLFFAQLKAAIRNGTLPIDRCDHIFNSMITNGSLQQAVNYNRMSVLNGLKTLGYNLNFLASSSIHTLAGSMTIATAEFLLEPGVDINTLDRDGYTTLWHIIQNIKNMSRVIGTDYMYSSHYSDDWRYHFSDVLFHRSSFTFRKRFVSDNISKALFVLDRGAAMTEDEAKQLDAALSVFAGKSYKNKEKYHGVPFSKLQYLRGLVKEKMGNMQQASYHLIEAATQGHEAAALKLAEYYLSTKNEEDALIWYQQSINNSAAPKPTLLHLIGLEKMIQLAHGISLRKTETSAVLKKEYSLILRELKNVDYSQQTISIDGLLQLAHLAIEHDASPEQYKFALKLACAGYNKARSEDKSRLAQAQQDIQHVINMALYKLPEEEAKHYAGINFMPYPSDCGLAHYYRLCLELAQVNFNLKLLNEDYRPRAQYWYEIASILSNKPALSFSENLEEAIEKELHDITSIVPDLIEDRSRDLGQVPILGFQR